MTTSKLYLCALPRAVWLAPAARHGLQTDLVDLVSEALACERRMRKAINLSEEQRRYTRCCQRIEQQVAASPRLALFKRGEEFASLVRNGRFPLFPLHPSYLDILAQAAQRGAAPERLGASFFPPQSLTAHREAFAHWASQQRLEQVAAIQHRIAFLRLAEANACGVVEWQSPFHSSAPNEATPPPVRRVFAAATLPPPAQEPAPAERSEHFRHKLKTNLRQHIRNALAAGEPVAFGSAAPHDVFTEVLHELVYIPAGSDLKPLPLRVVYNDGSEAAPFPIFMLPRDPRPLPELPPLRVALMSMRHAELDALVDVCWLRNRDVSRARTLAETDEFCYTATINQLRESLSEGDLLIHLYHTGFTPAVIGFYRGFAQILRGLRTRRIMRRLIVVPFYYRGEDGYAMGTAWQ
ncbi:hypothetical protein [Candidatus Viridilinea mediisalina]|uniref:Uncharacterized protein n=1 Tax=Candidatus Viridilinea mediisalina TaxID=2024553 RepID=A0A2A6RJX7_9CHLR|nr:hypothetical protein [Candidatus Viridilinea mediisalina]PDW03189.1 hypothetical protein CJ255_10020 [Candidatus Viridilinea mediisalina]